MKIMIISSIIILICLVTGILLYNYIEDTSEEYSSTIDEIKDLVSDENWTKAMDKLDILNKNWDKTEQFWKIIIEHQELDNIDEYFVSVNEYISEEEKPHALAELSILQFYIKHILEKEQLNLQNIF